MVETDIPQIHGCSEQAYVSSCSAEVLPQRVQEILTAVEAAANAVPQTSKSAVSQTSKSAEPTKK